MKPDIVSLFAGCGGMDTGFERAGFHIAFANEKDKKIAEVYRLNHLGTNLITVSVRA